MAVTAEANDSSFQKAKELRNSCTLKKYKHTNYPEVIAIIDHLFGELVEVENLRGLRKGSIAKLKYHIEFFVTNLYKAYCNDPKRVISYSRDIKRYSDKKDSYVRKFNLSHRYSVDTKKGKGVIPFLEKQGYIETFGFQYNRGNAAGRSYSSRMRATDKLINLIESSYNGSEDMFDEDTSNDETIVVKGLKLSDRWARITDSSGKQKRIKIKGKRKICKTPDTREVRQMRENLKIINAVMDKAEITLDISEKQLQELNARMLNDPNTNKQAIDFSRKRLHRVFLDRRLDRGGRFYGPWYQNIPKEYRQYILIDGAPTLELDYSSLHPNLLYYYAGSKPPEGDLYQLEDYSKSTRKFLKGMFLRMINSNSRNDAKGSIRQAVFYDKKVAIPPELGNLKDKTLDPIIDGLLEKHKPLSKYIFKFKNLGNWLQNIDSRIAEKVLLYFAVNGIAALPMHDSFIIDARHYQNLEDIMNRVILESFGTHIGISNDDYVPLVERMFGIIDEQIEKGSYDNEAFKNLVLDLRDVTDSLKSNLEKFEAIQERKTSN